MLFVLDVYLCVKLSFGLKLSFFVFRRAIKIERIQSKYKDMYKNIIQNLYEIKIYIYIKISSENHH